jgi:ATP-binding cassette, subfamily F, member 3
VQGDDWWSTRAPNRQATGVPTLHASGLTHSFGANTVFADVSFSLPPRERLALIGRNGAGKTTLLRVLAGEAEPDTGSVSYPKGYRIALHDQRPPLARNLTLGGYVGEGLTDVRAAEARLSELEARMAGGDGSPATLTAYDLAQRQLEAAGGYAWRARLGSILHGLGFADEQFERPLDSFSGGELTRASLARALASNPDLLLLDEPTNHLDLRSLEWLEDELASLDCAVLLVSHDRWFLERVATGVLELERGRAKLYNMRYSAYRRERAEALANQAEAFERQREEIARLERFVAKFKAGTRSRQAQSRQKELDRIERVEAPRKDRALAFGFPKTERSTRVALEAENLVVKVAERTLVERASFHIESGQRIALIGPNGSGKTTLVETLLGMRPAASGRVKIGHNVESGYFSQHASELRDNMTVIEAMLAGSSKKVTSSMARNILGRFLFTQDTVERRVEVLSGGERRRLALASLVASGANMLVLDEPTNHLDVESREALEDALDAYDGTILLITHDRALIDAVATHTASIEDRHVVLRHGDYNDYLAAISTKADAAPARNGPARLAPVPTSRAREPRRQKPAAAPSPDKRKAKRIRDIERRIDEIETRQAGLEAMLQEPEVLADHDRLAETGRALRDSQQELAWQMKEWEALQT